MPLARPMLAAAFLGACAAAVPAIAPARTQAGCGSTGYAYAGLAASRHTFGVSATLVPLRTPDVRSGHIGAWVGVGGVGAGPGGKDEWIQVGFSGFPGSATFNLYYEVAVPNQAPQYTEVESDLPVGTRRKVAVVEVRGRPDWWRVIVDGRAVGAPVRLPGSHGAWSPTATTESWGGGTFVCNRFSFRFQGLSVATAPERAWTGLRSAYAFQDHGYRVIRRARTSFVAGAPS
jgi:hypothetical protein